MQDASRNIVEAPTQPLMRGAEVSCNPVVSDHCKRKDTDTGIRIIRIERDMREDGVPMLPGS